MNLNLPGNIVSINDVEKKRRMLVEVKGKDLERLRRHQGFSGKEFRDVSIYAYFLYQQVYYKVLNIDLDNWDEAHIAAENAVLESEYGNAYREALRRVKLKEDKDKASRERLKEVNG